MKELPALTRDEIKRYSRQILLPEISMRGQQKLKNASVLLVGVGGLGSPVALYLAAAGIGKIGLVDADRVDLSNLQRQVIHSTANEGMLKVESARQRIHEINPDIQVETFPVRIDRTNAEEISSAYDVIVDGTDNIPSRYLLNDLAVLSGKPFVYGSIYRFEGQASIFGAKDGPCYRCLFPEPPPPGMIPSCSTAGVLGALPGLIGSIQAIEVTKLITGAGKTLAGKLLLIDAIDLTIDKVNIRRRADCKLCGEKPEITKLIDYEHWCGTGLDLDMGSAGNGLDIEPNDVKKMMDQNQPFTFLDIREIFEKQISDLPDTLHIPAAELPDRLDDLPQDKMVVIFCRNGIRSAQVVRDLHQKGYTQVRNLHGGINAWAEKIDSTLLPY